MLVLTLRELLLVLPTGPVYTPPPADPELRAEARRLAERDLALDQRPADWPQAERERWYEDLDRYRDLLHVYGAVRAPEKLKAPALWPEATVSIVTGALIAARVASMSDSRGQTWRFAPDLAVSAFDAGARRRAARVRGVTPETAPRMRVSRMALMIVVSLGLLATRRVGPRSWEFWLAARLVRDFDERRSWRSAFRS